MYSLRYGTIPIVRATGGLDDSVIDFTQDATRANGIKFQEYSARALAKAMRKALAIYEQPPLLKVYRQNAMRADFSWDKTVGEYIKVYEAAKKFSAGLVLPDSQTFSTLFDNGTWMIYLRGRIPQNIELKISHSALMDLLKLGQP